VRRAARVEVVRRALQVYADHGWGRMSSFREQIRGQGPASGLYTGERPNTKSRRLRAGRNLLRSDAWPHVACSARCGNGPGDYRGVYLGWAYPPSTARMRDLLTLHIKECHCRAITGREPGGTESDPSPNQLPAAAECVAGEDLKRGRLRELESNEAVAVHLETCNFAREL